MFSRSEVSNRKQSCGTTATWRLQLARVSAAIPEEASDLAERWPVVLPLGVLEYHGDHLPVGMDTLVVIKVLEIGSRSRYLTAVARLGLRR